MAQFKTIKNKIGKIYYYALIESVKWDKVKRIALGTDETDAQELVDQITESQFTNSLVNFLNLTMMLLHLIRYYYYFG